MRGSHLDPFTLVGLHSITSGATEKQVIPRLGSICENESARSAQWDPGREEAYSVELKHQPDAPNTSHDRTGPWLPIPKSETIPGANADPNPRCAQTYPDVVRSSEDLIRNKLDMII